MGQKTAAKFKVGYALSVTYIIQNYGYLIFRFNYFTTGKGIDLALNVADASPARTIMILSDSLTVLQSIDNMNIHELLIKHTYSYITLTKHVIYC